MYKKELVCGIEMCRGCEYEKVSTRTDKELFWVGVALITLLFVTAMVTL